MEEQQQNQLITYKRKNRHALSNTASDDSRLNIDPQYLNLYQEQTQVPEGNAAIGDDVRNTYKPSKKKQKQKQGVKKKSIQSNVADSENAMTNHPGFSIIKTKSWSGILRHRMAVKGLMHLVERLHYEQYSAIMETGFGGFLAVRTNCIPKQLARWLLEHFDPWDNSLKLANHKVLELTEEDVHASLGLPMGPQEVIEAKQVDNDIQYMQILENWRARWNVKSGGPPIGTMDETILERGDHGADFKRDFIVYVISTCIMGNANGTCHFRILKSLLDVDRIDNYNWCAYVIKCLNETVVDWQADRTKYFTGPLLFLMLCYLDRVEFRGKRRDRWFPTAINWTTEDVKKRERDERLFKKYGRGRIIQRLDYEHIMHVAEMDLQQEPEITEPDQHGELQMNVGTATFSQRQPQYWKRHIRPPDPPRNEPIQDSGAYTPVSDSIEKTCDDDILSQDDDVFGDPEFLETLFHVESEAVEYFQKKKSIGVTPPSAGLSISSKKGACLSPTLPFTPPSFSLGFSPKKGEVASSHEQRASNGREHPTSLKESNKENMSPNIIAESRLQHSSGNQFSRKAPCNKSREKILRVPRDPPQDKDKMVATRQQPKRTIKELPYVCRSPYLKDYKEARERLNSDELVVVDYVFLPVDEQHPVTEPLFEYDASEDDHKLWINRQGFETVAGANQDLENTIVDVYCLILNHAQIRRNPTCPRRMFFTTNVYTAIADVRDPKERYEAFETVMQLEVTRNRWLTINEAQLVFFPIVRDHHFFVLCFDFIDQRILIIDNRSPPKKVSLPYRDCPLKMTNLFATYLSNHGHRAKGVVRQFQRVFLGLEWQDNTNEHDCGIFAMRHMETFMAGNIDNWVSGFEQNKDRLLRFLRSKYTATILLHEFNRCRNEVLAAAKREQHQRQRMSLNLK